MDRNRPGGGPSSPGDLPSDFEECTAAQRSGGSHRFELVHFPEPRENQSAQPFGLPASGRLGWEPVVGLPGQEDDVAARMMREIEEAVAELRRQAAGRLIALQKPSGPPDPGKTGSGRLAEPCGVLYEFLFRIQERVRRLATRQPMQTAAAVIALGLAFGVALRLRK